MKYNLAFLLIALLGSTASAVVTFEEMGYEEVRYFTAGDSTPPSAERSTRDFEFEVPEGTAIAEVPVLHLKVKESQGGYFTITLNGDDQTAFEEGCGISESENGEVLEIELPKDSIIEGTNEVTIEMGVGSFCTLGYIDISADSFIDFDAPKVVVHEFVVDKNNVIVNGDFTLSTTLKNTGAVDADADFELTLPEGITKKSGEVKYSGELKAGAVKKLTAILSATKAGTFELGTLKTGTFTDATDSEYDIEAPAKISITAARANLSFTFNADLNDANTVRDLNEVVLTIVNDYNTPVAGIEVRITQGTAVATVTTDANGQAVIALDKTAGSLTVTVGEGASFNALNQNFPVAVKKNGFEIPGGINLILGLVVLAILVPLAYFVYLKHQKGELKMPDFSHHVQAVKDSLPKPGPTPPKVVEPKHLEGDEKWPASAEKAEKQAKPDAKKVKMAPGRNAKANFCHNCGASLKQGANFCHGCGHSQV